MTAHIDAQHLSCNRFKGLAAVPDGIDTTSNECARRERGESPLAPTEPDSTPPTVESPVCSRRMDVARAARRARAVQHPRRVCTRAQAGRETPRCGLWRRI